MYGIEGYADDMLSDVVYNLEREIEGDTDRSAQVRASSLQY